MSKVRVLIVDDEPVIAETLSELLAGWGYETAVASDGVAGLAAVEEFRPSVVISDVYMPNLDGFALLREVRELHPDTAVILLTGQGTVEMALRAIQEEGAFHYFEKPLDFSKLQLVVERAMEYAEARRENVSLRRQLRDRGAFGELVGKSEPMLQIYALIEQVAPSSASVLITGESGTGKELAARSLHAGSARASKPFVAVNCAAIPPSLVESELFGHVKGAFTGATTSRVGRFAQADRGTIFLDEIGEMETGVQAKLLRLIQDGELFPVGEETAQKIDVRILAATNRNLEREVASGRFRADLYWRLNVIPIEMPSLRARPTDITRLAEHFLTRANERHRRQVTGLDPQTMAALRGYPWPGNIRELENVIERLVIVKGSGTLMPTDLPPAIRTPRDVTPSASPLPELPTNGTDLRAMLEAVEERMIGEALERTGGNKNRAAELLGLNRTTLVEKLRRKRGPTPPPT
ncbi:MAG TPA: sigma-54 dependent transcriptional regulator [Pyrinomonadaceae bacterium]|nr:sigma-54 dependent transcriptional regulator [Pyrinomonadaceae bacterium]